MVRVDDVLDGFVGQLPYLGDDVVVVLIELVVDEHHAFTREQRRRISGDEIVMNDVQIVLDFHDVQFGGLRAELLTVEVGHPKHPARQHGQG